MLFSVDVLTWGKKNPSRRDVVPLLWMHRLYYMKFCNDRTQDGGFTKWTQKQENSNATERQVEKERITKYLFPEMSQSASISLKPAGLQETPLTSSRQQCSQPAAPKKVNLSFYTQTYTNI